MKVILLRDVARIGRRYEVKEVPAGHALNFLIPHKLVQVATPENLKHLASLKAKESIHHERETENFSAVLKQLEAKPVLMTVEANAQGHLFKGIKAEDIADILAINGMVVGSHAITLEEPIKALGTYEIGLHVGDQKGKLTLSIIAQ